MAYMHLTFSRGLRASVAAIGFAAITLAASGIPAHAQAEEDDEPFEQKVMRTLLGNPRGDIEYRERSPLVIPPGRDLPPPEAGPGVAADPAWPKDPDAAKRSRSAARSSSDPDKSARPLSPDEIKRGTVARSRDADRPRSSMSDNETGRPLLPSEYNRDGKAKPLFGLFSSKQAPEVFVEEPSRTRMTQPPSGYQTPSASQPYAPPKDQSWFKLPSVFDRGTSTDR
jgi:hypothetical protein